MALISYAQNGEDIVLNRALADVETGFYIDIGAFDPIADSVTQLFYDRGWNGINVEPVPAFHARFVAGRERDINLNVAVGRRSGASCLSIIGDTGLSTIRAEIAERHVAAGFTRTDATVEILTADELFERYVEQEVHFLKVDVEGSEGDVFAGLDLRRHRPWIILSEATEPNSQVRSDAEWGAHVAAQGYIPVLFDGLNMYFLAEEHRDRLGELSKPTNVFDAFVTHHHHALAADAAAKAQRIAELEAAMQQLQAEADALRAAAQAERADLAARIAHLEAAATKRARRHRQRNAVDARRIAEAREMVASQDREIAGLRASSDASA